MKPTGNKVTVFTNVYYFTHMKQPRGFGSWAFRFNKCEKLYWAYDCLYSEAVNQAKKYAKNKWPDTYVDIQVEP